MSGWYYHASSVLTSPSVLDSKNFTQLIFVAQAHYINSERKCVETKIFSKKGVTTVIYNYKLTIKQLLTTNKTSFSHLNINYISFKMPHRA
jgi:hypothetical protein